MPNIVMGQQVDSAKLERAKELRRFMTPAERILWQALRTNKLPGLHFRRQQVISGFIVDFYCHAVGLVVEVDGAVHEGESEADAQRDAIIVARGLRVLRIRNDDVQQDLPGVLSRILTAAREAGPLE